MKIEIELEEVDRLRDEIRALAKENLELKTILENSDTCRISKMGKDFKGNKLNEDNCYVAVLYKKHLYRTGNRRHFAVELFDCYGQFDSTVDCAKVKLVDLKFKY